MSSHRLIVLKFGGSVLRDEQSLRLAVHDIYRWRRNGWRVIAVVSALAGKTDELLAGAERTSKDADPYAVAALIGTGELQSAGLLGLHLDRAGIPAAVIWPMSCRLIAEGPPLDAEPLSLDAALLRRALAQHGVVVLPGYAAQDRHGRPVVLGRGGSDLTALFAARTLGARKCRLIKDVDGLYDRDPDHASARRYATATFEEALATDGSVIQHKAVRFAHRHGLRFELGRINGCRLTVIGAPRSRFAAPERPRRLKVALLGLGTVGGGVYELLRQMPEQFEVRAVAVRDPSRPRALRSDGARLTGDAVSAAQSGADIVVEAIGGCDVALRAARAALSQGAAFVTANKSLIAGHGEELHALAKARGAVRSRLLYSAAVGGSMPLLERLAPLRDKILSIRAVINGTTNYILSRIDERLPLSVALRQAQELGFAEQDPTRDLAGLDAADKLCIIARALGARLLPADVSRDVISEASIAAAMASCTSGGPLRHVAHITLSDGVARGEVRLTSVSPADPLGQARGAGNVALISLEGGRREVLTGRGAGRWPTAEAVVADLLYLSRQAVPGRRRRRLAREMCLAAALTGD